MENITITKREYNFLIKENEILNRLLQLHEEQKQMLKELELQKRLHSLYPTPLSLQKHPRQF